jgi:UDP-3-O-[3-hydroxymyristoyl] glucosamine N-acyltransferase
MSFFHNPRYKEDLLQTQAGAIVVSSAYADFVPLSAAILETEKPLKTFGQIVGLFYGELPRESGIHPQATVEESARLGDDCEVGPGAYIGPDVVIGAGSVIGAHAVIERGVTIGKYCCIGSHVTLSHAILGDHVIIKPGARVGQAGFGFFLEGQDLVKQPQLGCVILEDHVEVGANTTIDRGSLRNTVIKAYTHIDNLCQIAHNVHVGQGSILAAQTGIAGSSRLGAGVMCGGQSGISGHVNLGNGVKVLAQSGVMRDVASGEEVAGSPAIKRQAWHRQNVLLSKLPKCSKLVKKE